MFSNKQDCIRGMTKDHTLTFKEGKLNSEIYIKSPYTRGCLLWKQLPSHIQNVSTLVEFKHLLTRELINYVTYIPRTLYDVQGGSLH